MFDATDTDLDSLAVSTVARVRHLVDDAERLRTRHERATRRRFTRLFDDPHALDVTIALTDEVMRFSTPVSAAATLRRTARHATTRGFGVLNAVGLRVIAVMSRVVPSLVVRVVHGRIRSLSSDLIVDARPRRLRRYRQRRVHEGLGVNINVLGEAVLGVAEAQRRLERILEMMRREGVNYVSVKVSSIVSQLVTVDVAGSLDVVEERLRTLYRESLRSDTFVNLDMEEFRDLRLTVDAFRRVLDEQEFARLEAGIVLQAYLPESHGALDELLTWAQRRVQRGGARIKIRLVKGANLAMERAEAQVHGWTPAPYGSKSDVDASYARLLDVSLRPQWSNAVRVGVASHNLFHVAWALEVAAHRGVGRQLDVEMLEGMANAEALAIVRGGQPVLLYTPVTRADDFASAVAYLVRRLDENTSVENYLRAGFLIAREPRIFDEQRRRFEDSLSMRHQISTSSRRHGHPRELGDVFDNSSDGDPTDPRYVHEVLGELASIRAVDDEFIGEPVNGVAAAGRYESGGDPSAGGKAWYRYGVASRSVIDAAIQRARVGASSWALRSPVERRDVLNAVARVIQRRRATTVAVMSRDAGKTIGEADPEVSEAIDFVRFYAQRGLHLDGSAPLGVVLVVPPWNFPFAIPSGGVAAALAAGNSVVLKPAPEAVATSWSLVQQFWEGGVPHDALQFVPVRDDSDGRHLVTHEGVDAVLLTGSFATASLFTSWKPDMRLLGETSGKNAMLISACADMELAVKDLVQSAFGHAGQKCSAASLGIVVGSVYDSERFRRQLTDAVNSLVVGPSYHAGSSVGPLIRAAEPALQRALSRLDDGESWLVEPSPLDEAGLLWRPGVKLGVRPGSWSHTHEWFGPVLALMSAPDFQTAVDWQNQVDFGLTAGLQSLDEAECEYWIERVQAGNLYVNRGVTGAVVNRQPFGGWKRSSVGPTAKTGGPHYVHSLRAWPPVARLDDALEEMASWWATVASTTRDPAGLDVERNVQRYRLPMLPIGVRIDGRTSAVDVAYLRAIQSLTGVSISMSSAATVAGAPTVTVETIPALVQRCAGLSKVRWLGAEPAPVEALLERGVSVDSRPLAQAGAVEGARWLLEQSVSITNHRYGNVNAGPKPVVRGLGK